MAAFVCLYADTTESLNATDDNEVSWQALQDLAESMGDAYLSTTVATEAVVLFIIPLPVLLWKIKFVFLFIFTTPKIFLSRRLVFF